jgi:isoleucyl-tRNA synthetase
MDRWMLERTAELARKCREWYVNYEFHRVYHAIHDFCVVDLSAFYYDVLKDRLYTKAPKSKSRRSAQTAVWKITSALVRLAAPILVFTTEEIWKYLPKSPGDPESTHMTVFPSFDELSSRLDEGVRQDWSKLLEVRQWVLSRLEDARNRKIVNSSLDSKIILRAKDQLFNILKNHEAQLPGFLIVSQVNILPFDGPVIGDTPNAYHVEVQRAAGTKCERCWNYSTHVGENKRYPTICERCSEALAEIETGLAAHN